MKYAIKFYSSHLTLYRSSHLYNVAICVTTHRCYDLLDPSHLAVTDTHVDCR